MVFIESVKSNLQKKYIKSKKFNFLWKNLLGAPTFNKRPPPPKKKREEKKITVCPKLFTHSNRTVLHELMIQKVIIFLSQNHLDKTYLNISYLVPSQDLAHQNMTMRMLEF